MSNVINITARVRPRWLATITYRTDAGPEDVDCDFEELCDLHDHVEHGPDWNCIEQIAIRLNPHRRIGNHTVEEAEGL